MFNAIIVVIFGVPLKDGETTSGITCFPNM